MSIVGDLISGAEGAASLYLQYQQLQIAQAQLELQEDTYYDDLTSSYYDYMSQIADMESEQSSAQTSINQAQEDIATNQEYLSRWGEEYSGTMQSAVDSAYSTYAEQASALSDVNASNSAAGKSGGSASILAKVQQNSVNKLVGDSGSFNLSSGSLASTVNSTAQDLLAERQTASSAIDTGYSSIQTYQDTISSLSESIASMESTTADIKTKLEENGRSV